MNCRVVRASGWAIALVAAVSWGNHHWLIGRPAQAQMRPDTSPNITQMNKNPNRLDAATGSVALDDFSRELLEIALLASDHTPNLNDQLAITYRLAQSYASFGEPEKMVEVYQKSLTVIDRFEEEYTRLSALLNLANSIAKNVPANELNSFLDSILINTTGEISNAELQQTRRSASALRYANDGEVERAIETANKIDNKDFRARVLEFVRTIAIRQAARTDNTLLLNSIVTADLTEYEFPEEPAVQSPEERFTELLRSNAFNSEQTEQAFEQQVAEQVEIIQSISSDFRRANYYQIVGEQFLFRNDFEGGIRFLNLANEALEQGHADLESDDRDYAWLYLESIKIANSFIRTGYIEQGLSQIRVTDNAAIIVPVKIDALIDVAYRIAQTRGSDPNTITTIEGIVSEVDTLLALVELNEEGIDLLVRAASSLYDIGFNDKATELLQQVSALYESGDLLEIISDPDDFLQTWVYALKQAGNYELAVEIVLLSDNGSLLRKLPAELLAAEQEDKAQDVLAQIDEPNTRADALVSMALVYESLGRLEEAQTSMVQALTLSQTVDLAERIGLDERLEGNPSLTLYVMRSYIAGVGIERAEQLLPFIMQDNIRIPVLLQLFPMENVLPSVEGLTLSDSVLRMLARRAIANNNITGAMEVIAQMTTPRIQANLLISIAEKHAENSADVDGDSRALLQQIGDRYR